MSGAFIHPPMPIKFPCDNCRRVLSVSSRKTGRKAKCPSCAHPLVVPNAEEAEAAMAARKSAADSGDDADSSGEFSEFAVYDDEEDFDFEPREESEARPDPAVALDRVAVPRLVLYVQGALLGVVALVCFALGLLIGLQSAGTSDPAASRPTPCQISGTVVYLDEADRRAPDEGAVVMVLPMNRRPDEKIDYEGLRASDEPPSGESAAVAAIHRLGGAFVRADAEGNFKLRVPDRGDYHVLVISAWATRSNSEQRDLLRDFGQVGGYVTSAADLIEDRRYRWTEQRVMHDLELNVSLN